MEDGVGNAVGALIVDDEEDMRVLLRAVIDAANEGLHVAGEAASGSEALEAWRRHRPHVIVLDQRMPDIDGLSVAEQILAEQPDQSIILFSAYLDSAVLGQARRIGVRACISKHDISSIPDALWAYAPEAS